MKMKEIRKLDMQFRSEDTNDGKMEIKGYAVVFNSPETYWGYTEVIDPRALDEADMSDVVLRYNHNDSFMVLARTRNNSLKLETDNTGLMIDATLQNDITEHRDIFNAIKSQLIDKQSFAFTVEEDEYDYDTDTRTITKIGKLFDVSVVDQPFYNGTDVSVARKESNDFLERREELRKQHELEMQKDKIEARKKEILAKLG
jgi:hypothetical protein